MLYHNLVNQGVYGKVNLNIYGSESELALS